MTDGISEAYRAQKESREIDLPMCPICLEKMKSAFMQPHIIGNHTAPQMAKALVDFSLYFWKKT